MLKKLFLLLLISTNAFAGNTFRQPVSLLNQNELRFKELESNGQNYAGFKASASLAGDTIYTLPTAFPASNGLVLSSDTTGVLSWGSTLPTVQKFTTGGTFGTYTTPSSPTPKYLRVIMVGGGGGGSGSGTSTGSVAGDGTASTFGTALLSAGGGIHGVFDNIGGAGGTSSLGAAIGTALAGGMGGTGQRIGTPAVTGMSLGGAMGGSSALGGGASGGTGGGSGAGSSSSTPGGGGGSAAAPAISNAASGGGGGAGGYVNALIGTPDATYGYNVGSPGAAGGAGAGGGYVGGAGGAGYIIVEEYYQ